MGVKPGRMATPPYRGGTIVGYRPRMLAGADQFRCTWPRPLGARALAYLECGCLLPI